MKKNEKYKFIFLLFLISWIYSCVANNYLSDAYANIPENLPTPAPEEKKYKTVVSNRILVSSLNFYQNTFSFIRDISGTGRYIVFGNVFNLTNYGILCDIEKLSYFLPPFSFSNESPVIFGIKSNTSSKKILVNLYIATNFNPISANILRSLKGGGVLEVSYRLYNSFTFDNLYQYFNENNAAYITRNMTNMIFTIAFVSNNNALWIRQYLNSNLIQNKMYSIDNSEIKSIPVYIMTNVLDAETRNSFFYVRGDYLYAPNSLKFATNYVEINLAPLVGKEKIKDAEEVWVSAYSPTQPWYCVLYVKVSNEWYIFSGDNYLTENILSKTPTFLGSSTNGQMFFPSFSGMQVIYPVSQILDLKKAYVMTYYNTNVSINFLNKVYWGITYDIFSGLYIDLIKEDLFVESANVLLEYKKIGEATK